MIKPVSAIFSSMLCLLILISGCSPQPETTHSTDTPSDCSFPGTEAPAPDWICSGAYQDTVLSAQGSAKVGRGGLPLAKQSAVEQAKAALAAQAVSRTTLMINDLLDKTAVSDEQRTLILQMAEQQTGSESLSRADLLATATSPDQQLFVLIGISQRGMLKTQGYLVDLLRLEYPEIWQQIQSALAAGAKT